MFFAFFVIFCQWISASQAEHLTAPLLAQIITTAVQPATQPFTYEQLGTLLSCKRVNKHWHRIAQPLYTKLLSTQEDTVRQNALRDAQQVMAQKHLYFTDPMQLYLICAILRQELVWLHEYGTKNNEWLYDKLACAPFTDAKKLPPLYPLMWSIYMNAESSTHLLCTLIKDQQRRSEYIVSALSTLKFFDQTNSAEETLEVRIRRLKGKRDRSVIFNNTI